MTTTAQTLTPATLALFKYLVNDAPNWNGEPMVDMDKEQRGNLTHLKRAGLVETFKADGDSWVRFTDKGIEFAKELGLDVSSFAK